MLLTTLLSVALIIFLAGNAARVIQFLRIPVPLRWELYPIPKGPRERQVYGGSYFENSNWWTKPENTSHRGNLIFAAKEVLFLESVRRGFPALWFASWLLHWGMYLYLLASLLLGAGMRLRIESLCAVATTTYCVSCATGLLGSAGVLLLRSWHPRLRAMTTRSSIFDLLFIGSIFTSGLLALMRSTVRADVMIEGPTISSAQIAHLVLLAAFFAYFPFTHMTHAYMKFFTWHGVRWDDSPAIHNSHAAGTLATNLRRKVAWAAPHFVDDARATWADVVADKSGRGAAKRA